ncbi:nucleotide-binding protein [Nocardia puris]|uniref:nucleotide-binding protein n=1 Tax=Nocardia puris TaxID=208602 RepID=UPI00389A9A05
MFTQPGAPSPTGPRPPEGSAPGGFPAPSGAENSGAPGGFAPAQGVHRAPVSDQPAPGELHRAPGVFSQGAPGQVGPVGGPVPGVAPSAQGGHRAPTSDPAPGAVRRDPGVFEQPGQQPPAGGPATQWGTGEYQQQGVAPAGHGPVPPQAAPSWNRGQHGQVPEGWGRPQHPQPQQMSGPPPSLDDVPMRRAKKAPGSGWRKAVHHVSGGAINPGMSAEERRLQELVARIRQPVRGDYRIAVLSLKGGVGKTTTTMGLGSIFASIRGDRVIAVDANPDFGTLSQRVPLQTRSTVRDLLLDPSIQRYSDVRRHTSQATSRLEVLASERDPAASEAFNDEEYRAVARILQRFYNIILTDCGTGLMHSAMAGVLDLAHSLVLISSAAIDGARSAAATLDWLSLHGHDHLVRNAVVVINLPREGSPNVGVQQLREYFLSRCRAVHIIPYDTHLSEGAEIDLHRLSKQAKRAYVELAATVADEFGVDHRHYHN